ncbi:MAG: hypothetical protein AAFW60_12660, partial [Pseudomonadota bacterium]
MRQALAPKIGRRPANRGAARNRTWTKTFGSPVRGKVTNRSPARPLADSALVLENWFPTLQGAQVRGGSLLHATIGADDVTAMFAYRTAGNEKIFAANASAIYDVTSPADSAVIPTPVQSGLSGGYWSTAQFETSGGQFLSAVNGADTPRQYDGTTWSNSTMSGTGLTTSNLSHVWSFKERLFFIESGTMNVWYLPVGSITGALTQFSLGGVFKLGGSLYLGGTWSLDAGDGLDDFLVLVSTLGEVAIYQGTDPSNASTWRISGRYKIPPPIGRNATFDAGGNLLIATTEGIVPISEAVTKDRAVLSLSAVTSLIEPDWIAAVDGRQSLPWDLVRWDNKNLMVVCSPSPSAAIEDIGFVQNLETGAAAKLTGWDMHCGAVLNGVFYFGNGSGQIMQGDAGGSDNGAIYTCKYASPFWTGRTAYKVSTLAKAFFRASKGFIAQLS